MIPKNAELNQLALKKEEKSEKKSKQTNKQNVETYKTEF